LSLGFDLFFELYLQVWFDV